MNVHYFTFISTSIQWQPLHHSPSYRYGGHFEFYCFKKIYIFSNINYGMLRGQTKSGRLREVVAYERWSLTRGGRLREVPSIVI